MLTFFIIFNVSLFLLSYEMILSTRLFHYVASSTCFERFDWRSSKFSMFYLFNSFKPLKVQISNKVQIFCGHEELTRPYFFSIIVELYYFCLLDVLFLWRVLQNGSLPISDSSLRKVTFLKLRSCTPRYLMAIAFFDKVCILMTNQ